MTLVLNKIGHTATILLISVIAVFGSAIAANGASAPFAVRDIAYTDKDHPEQTLDIYRPEKAENAPVIVFVHGGAWIVGDKHLDAADPRAYTDRGVIVVSINYRLAPQNKYPDNLSDIHAAARWIRTNISTYGGDPDNMVLVGHSAGAHLVTLAGVGSSTLNRRPLATQFNAVFSIDTATYDLTRRARKSRERLVNRAIVKTFGRKRDVLYAASPIYQVDQNIRYNPIYLFVTEARPKVVGETERMAGALSAAKQSVSTHIISGDVSHAGMRDMIFQSGSETFDAIWAEFRGMGG